MIKTKTGWAAGFGAAALIVALGLAAAVSPPTQPRPACSSDSASVFR